MSTKAQREKRTNERGLLAEDLAATPETGKAGSEKAHVAWAALVAENGTSPFRGKEFLRSVASGRAGIPALGGPWPGKGPQEWREEAGVTALDVASTMQVPAMLVEAWEAGEEPCADNWRGGEELDDLSARRLYGAFKSFAESGPYGDPPEPVPVPARPPVKVVGGEGFPGPELLEAAALGYEVPVTSLAGEGRFLRTCVRGEVVGIPTLAAVPSGEALRTLRETFNYSPERLGALLGAAASRVEAWEAEIAIPGADCDGGLSSALRLYGVLALVAELRQAAV